MFRTLGNWANRHWLTILVVWCVAAGGLYAVAPSWDEVALDGDFDYLPDEVTSRQAHQILKEAFPADEAKSSTALVFARKDNPLTNEDKQFVIDVTEQLKQIPGLPLVGNVLTPRTRVVGKMLESRPTAEQPGSAQMVLAKMSTDMMAVENVPLLKQVELVLDEARKKAPAGLEIGLSGAAMIGADIQDSVRESVSNTELMTVGMVILCLVAIYRAPLLVLIPLTTIGISLVTANSIVALLAKYMGPDDVSWGGLQIFTTTKIFVVVILFGAGTDFCLFLIARFKEELGLGRPLKDASGDALANVGDALAASAFTTILGLGTMAFADYGKFVYSGPVVALCLFIALVACLTFAPALLRALGKVVFWPTRIEHFENEEGEEEKIRGGKLWGWIANWILRRPGTILFGSAWIAAPFLIAGIFESEVSHDLMAELAPTRATVTGTKLISEYFEKGEVAPTLVVAKTPLDLKSDDNQYALAFLHEHLLTVDGVIDVRSQYKPVGKVKVGAAEEALISGSPDALATFVSEDGHVAQLQVILAGDPFARETRDIVTRIEEKLAAVTAGTVAQDRSVEEPIKSNIDKYWKGTQFELGGTTPGIRDLERVTISDQTRIQVLVTAAVFLVILVLLRDFMVCVYLIITVLMSYWVTIGMTQLFFQVLYGDTYDGLDWKVPIFLFVILIAVGQDYNIYLTTRVFEEQKKVGKREGLRRAIVLTGGIITSCGVIMAGTFVSMTAGTLRAMIELGFSLSLGVLLDTFFVRTVIVPCFFALMANRAERRQAATSASESSAERLSTTKSTTPPALQRGA